MSKQHTNKRKKRKPALVPRRAWSVNEFCQSFNLSRATVYKLMATGRLAYVEIAGMRRIPNEESDRLALEGDTQ